jgi:ketosteroid isomerase-like protein
MENTPTSPDPNQIILEQPLATPHFDEEAIKTARPAVPLARAKARRSWLLALVLMSGSALLGGVLALALARYQNSSRLISTPAANVTPSGASQNGSEPTPSVADAEDQASDAQPRTIDANAESTRPVSPAQSPAPRTQSTSDVQDDDARALLHDALYEWIAATNARDIKRQMGFYDQTVNAFYLTHNVPREAVRAEKSRVFHQANLIDIRAAAPSIHLGPDGRTATMRFRKKYAIEGGGEDRRGEVVQQLNWRRTAEGWKIISERDLRVID